MKLSLNGHSEISFCKGHLGVISTDNPVIYTQLITGVSQETETLKIFDDEYNFVDTSKALRWWGDVLTIHDLNELVIKEASKNLVAEMSDDQLQQLTEEYRQIGAIIQQSTNLDTIPLEVDPIMDIKRIIKMVNLHLNHQLVQSPYDTIEVILKSHMEFNSKKWVVLNNVHHVLNFEQIQNLIKFVEVTDSKAFLIEFSDINCQQLFENTDWYHIDHDFIDWHS